MKKIILLGIVCFAFLGLSAQTTAKKNTPGLGKTNFAITGGGMLNFNSVKGSNGFGGTGFHMMPMAKIGDRMYFLSEIEVGIEDGEANFELESTNLYYKLNKYMVIHAGRFLPKFGNFRGRFQGFLNRLSNNPVGFGDGGIGPMIETGVGLQGGAQLGASKINYDFYVSGGPVLLSGSAATPDEAGQFNYESWADNNNSKAFGGRIGFLPFSNSSLEIGIAGETSAKTGDLGSANESTSVNMFDVDVNYYKVISGFTVRFMGDYKSVSVSNATYTDYSNVDSFGNFGTYTFNNNSHAYYTQLTLRPSGVDNEIISNLEFVGRFSSFKGPNNALWGGNTATNQTAFGVDYYLSWSNIIKFSYVIQDGMPNQFQSQVIFRF